MAAIYIYECKCGNTFEEVLPISDFDKTEYMKCPKCGESAKRIISNRGALRDEPTWLASACMTLQPDDERPLQTRSEFNRYLKKHDIGERHGYGPVLISV